ncbi:MAG: tRNA (adenosine(37)-N6)-threonylcarbamoyltransferase complex ATPase subunit type 1 TsaE [Solirubrobacterales bacterium]
MASDWPTAPSRFGVVTFVRMIAGRQTEQFTTDSPEATERVAARVAERLRPGDFVLLAGELGSGKTTFVRGAARALGVSGRVTSPTFAIGNVYDAADGEIAHLDLYRLDDIAVGDEAVLDDFLTPARIGFVEWPHAELADRPGLRARVQMAHAGGDARTIEVAWVEAEEAA